MNQGSQRSKIIDCRNYLVHCVISFSLSLAFPSLLHAQNYLTMTGISSSTAPYPVEMGTVDAANGNLHLEIPLGSFPQRGGAAALVPKFVYDSHIWTVPTDSASAVWTTTGQVYALPSGVPGLAFGTWGFADGGVNGPFMMANDNICDQDALLWGESGAQHIFNIPGTMNGDQCSGGTAYAVDSSGAQIRETAFSCDPECNNIGNDISIYAPDGTELWGGNLFPNGIAAEDSNGNYLGLTYSSPNYSTLLQPGVANPVIDTLGRTVVTVENNNYASPVTLQLPNAQGSSSNGLSNYVVSFASIPVSTDFGESGVSECNDNCTIEVITSIGLPDGSNYSFQYDCYQSGNTACGSPSGQSGYYGTLTQMTLPTGATVAYAYENFTDARGSVSRWLRSKTSSITGTWYYTPQSESSTSNQVSVTRPDGSADTLSLTIDGSGSVWPTEVQSYDTNGALLSTVNNTWDFSIPCTTILCSDDAYYTGCVINFASCYPHQDIRKLSSTTTLPIPSGSITKQTVYKYDSPQTANITAVQEWKYQSGTNPMFASVPDRATYMTYATIGTNNNINRPISITVCNNVGTSDSNCSVGGTTVGGTTVARTTITYDAYGSSGSLALQSITGIVNHDDTNFGLSNTARGNATQINQWVSGSSYLTTALSYDTTGQVIQSQDSKSNVTTYSYVDAEYEDNGSDPPQTYQPAKPTNAYVTKVTDAIGTTSYAYYFWTGQTAFATDYDGDTTYSHYIDPFNRQTDTDYPVGWLLNQYHAPSGGQTEIDSYSPVSDTGSASASCTGCAHSQVILDGLGRVVTQSLVNNLPQQSYIYATYDVLNRFSTTSHPNFGSSDPNDVVETQTYDGLSRTLSVSHPDGQSSRMAYGPNITNLGGVSTQQSSPTIYGYGFPVVSIDEAGQQRQEWIDGFGHVIEMDEPTGSTPPTPGQGYITIYYNSGENSYTFNPCPPPQPSCPTTVYNSGTVSATINGFTEFADYGPSPEYTVTSVATALAAAFNVANSPVTAVVNGGVCPTGSTGCVSFTAIGDGSNTNFSFTASASYDTAMCGSQACFSGPSFYPSPGSGTFTGGSGGIVGAPLVTTYVYDALGNLTGVTQGSQTRTWTYDGLSRLTKEATPEAGMITLSYATSTGLCSGKPSNPCTRTAPAPNQTGSSTVITTYTYDTANRLTKQSYSDNSNTISYTYKTAANGKGFLGTMTDSSGSETYTYNSMKLITEVAKKIGSTTYSTSFAYNTAEQLTKIVYPSGRTVWYNYDSVGHLCQVATATNTSCNASTPYLTLASSQYDAAGRSLSATYGNGVVASVTYSPQTAELTSLSYAKGSTTLFGLNYFYQYNSTSCPAGNSTGNNGQIQCILDVVQPGRNVSYTYDTLGRLLTAATSGSTHYAVWGLSETYDRYGNRTNQTVTAGTGPSGSWSVNAANNQITSFTYDAAGNVMSTPSPSETWTYDHSECNTAYTGNGNSAAYTCDGNGMRVEKAVTGTNAVTTVYVRVGGQVLAEYDNGAAVTSPTREYLYGNNLLATVTGSTGGSGGTIIYQHRDHLSPRLYTDVNGNCVGDQGTFPFGEQWYVNTDPNCATTASSSWMYTSYERDAESENDYALARSYADTQGRFLSPDPLEGIVGDPQSWNRYAYVENDPINVSDPSGQGFWEDLGFAIADIFASVLLGPEVGAVMTAAEEGAETSNQLLIAFTVILNDGTQLALAAKDWAGTRMPFQGERVVPLANGQWAPEGDAAGQAAGNAPASAPAGDGGPGAGTAQDAGGSGQGPGGGGATTTSAGAGNSGGAGLGSGGVWNEGPMPGSTEDIHPGLALFYNNPQCRKCGTLWQQTNHTMKAVTIGMTAAYVAAPVVAETAVLAEGGGLGVNVAGRIPGAFRQFTIYSKQYGNVFSIGVDTVRGWHIGLGAGATGHALYHLALNPFRW
jgi:RHS repeat-associated protein